jgi:hypothetical protein
MQTGHLSDKEFCDYFQPETDREREMLRRMTELLEENLSFQQAEDERAVFDENQEDYEEMYRNLNKQIERAIDNQYDSVDELKQEIRDLIE